MEEREEARRRGSDHAWYVLEEDPQQIAEGWRSQPAYHCIDNGVLKDGYIWPDGQRVVLGRRREYFPFAHPELVSSFSKLREGDEQSVLAFAHRWGLLGYDDLTHSHPGWLESSGYSQPSWEWIAREAAKQGGFLDIHIRPVLMSPAMKIVPAAYFVRHADEQGGDPLSWIWAHADSVRRLLRLIELLKTGSERDTDRYLTEIAVDRRVPSKVPTQDIGPWVFSHFLFAVGIESQQEIVTDTNNPKFTTYRLSGKTSPMDEARDLVSMVLDRNLADVRPLVLRTYERAVTATGLQRDLSFGALLSVIYWHLSESAIGHRAYRQCAECGGWFEQTHALQNYCPPYPKGTESRCAVRARQRRFKAAVRAENAKEEDQRE